MSAPVAKLPGVVRHLPLRTPDEPVPDLLFGPVHYMAHWLAYVGLAGRFCFVRTTGQWHRLGPSYWQPCDHAVVVREVRRVLGEQHDARLFTRHHVRARASLKPEQRAKLARLLERANQPGPLVLALRHVVTVEQPPMRRFSGPKHVRSNDRRVRCETCDKVSTPAAIGSHQSFTGHVGRAEVTTTRGASSGHH